MATLSSAALLLASLAHGVAAPPPQDSVDQARLLATIRSLPAKRAPMPDEAHRQGLSDTESILAAALRALGHEPTLQEFVWTFPLRKINAPDAAPAGEPQPDAPQQPAAATPAPEPGDPPAAYRNILLDLPGADLKHEVIIVSAHFDAVPNSPGADDDGSGVAAVLELARVLKDHPTRRTIRLALFNLEEVGLVGANHYVTDWVKRSKQPLAEGTPKEKIVGMLSLEMLGYFTDAPDSQKSPIPRVEGVFDLPTVGDSICVVGIARNQAFSSSLARAMKAASPELKLTLVDFLPVPVPDMTRSDHRPFLMAGLPAVMITDTANFRNPNYHKPTDTLDTLDPTRLTLVVKAVAGAVYEIAQPVP